MRTNKLLDGSTLGLALLLVYDLFMLFMTSIIFVVDKNEHLRNKSGIYDPCGR